MEETYITTETNNILNTKIDIVRRVRDGIFLSASRTYAEQYIEPLIRKKYNLKKPINDSYDATNQSGSPYEIKAGKILKVTDDLEKILDRILYECDYNELDRLISFDECNTIKYNVGIQNIKRDHFDILMYVLLFKDCVKVFSAKKEDLENFPNWSDKHGRYDELGKSGQFPIKKKNIQWHLDNHLMDTLSWGEITDIYIELSK